MKQISKAVPGQKRAVSAQKNTVVKAKSTKAAKGIQPEPKLALDPRCKEFPPMEHDDFNFLKESILRNGQLQLLLVWQGRVLDGRHRLKACADLGIQPTAMEAVLPEYLWRFRPSGQYAAIKDSAKNLRKT